MSPVGPERGDGPQGPKKGRALTPHPGRVLNTTPAESKEPERIAAIANALHKGLLRAPGLAHDRNALLTAIYPWIRTVQIGDVLSAAAVLVEDGRATTTGSGLSQTWSTST